MPTPVALIRNVRPWGAAPADIHLADGRVASVVEHDPTRTPEQTDGAVVEGDGRLCLPTFSDAHVHLDSTRLGLPFRPHTGAPGVWAMMLNDRANWRQAEASVTERAGTTVEMMVARGTTHMRAYAQVDIDARLERLRAVLQARAEFADSADIEVVAFPQAGLLREEGSIGVLEEAMSEGADVVGGLDPSQLDRDPVTHLDVVFGLAEQYQRPIDIHLHEPGTLGAFTMELIMERTRVLGMQGRVTIAHAFALGTVDAVRRAELLEQMAELGIALTTVAPAGAQTLPLQEAVAAGVRVGLGEDGQRDYWSPYGNADMLDRTWQLAFTNGFRADRLVERCLEVATLGGRSVRDAGARALPVDPTDLSHRDLTPGDPADFVLLEGETPTSAVMDRPADRVVIHRGRLVKPVTE